MPPLSQQFDHRLIQKPSLNNLFYLGVTVVVVRGIVMGCVVAAGCVWSLLSGNVAIRFFLAAG